MSRELPPTVGFDAGQDGHARVSGSLDFTTVSALLPVGVEAITGGHVAVMDLSDVAASDSSGLALLIEWLSAAKRANRTLRYVNIPSQLKQLAGLSEVEELLEAV